jgi:uncharacterized protein YozE (UPF0346 family)
MEVILLLTYKEWLLKFKGVNLPIGDIAAEVELDDNFPNTKDYESLHEYLESNYTDSFMRVFEYSFKMFYESTQKKF